MYTERKIKYGGTAINQTSRVYAVKSGDLGGTVASWCEIKKKKKNGENIV